MASTLRRPMYRNDRAISWRAPATTPPDAVRAFHRTLPLYSPTRLVALPKIAEEIGVGTVYLKDEGQRFGLPAFKILGASWAVFRAVTQRLGLPLDADLAAVREGLSKTDQLTTLLAATDGNHGRAVARMGSILGMKVQIYVPKRMDVSTAQKIQGEGASVIRVDGSYDQAVELASGTAGKSGRKGILVQDNAFPGYEKIPQLMAGAVVEWVVDGYSTMMIEIDEQLGNQKPDLVITPVGVGSLAQAVVTHFKAPRRSTRVLTVEADTAACLYKSLSKGKSVVLEDTVGSIMAGLDCGTVSSTAWPLLQAGVDASCSVSDFEAHDAVGALQSLDIAAGPCGASPLAALRRLTGAQQAALGLGESSVVVLLCTEGSRDYPVPMNVGLDNAQSIAQMLVRIALKAPEDNNSSSEIDTDLARYVEAWLEHRSIESSKAIALLSGLAKDDRLSGNRLVEKMGDLAEELVTVARVGTSRL